jgi:hypothetical protein
MSPQIFISYSHQETESAVRLATNLESEGYEVWLDRTDIQTGSHWDDEIVKGLNASEIFVVLLSNQSTESQNVKDEIGYAIDHNKHILPILLEECDVPFRLRRVQYVDFTQLKFEEGMQKVRTILKSFLSSPAPESKGKTSAKKEKLMDPATLAASITTLLAPYLAKFGESLMEQAGAQLPAQVAKIWKTISSRFQGNPTAVGVANDLAKEADDTDNQEAFTLQLKKFLRDDHEFAGTLQALLKETQGQISNVGDGVVATNGGIGVGKVEIGRDLRGNIVIGNNNQVTEKPRNPKKK